MTSLYTRAYCCFYFYVVVVVVVVVAVVVLFCLIVFLLFIVDGNIVAVSVTERFLQLISIPLCFFTVYSPGFARVQIFWGSTAPIRSRQNHSPFVAHNFFAYFHVFYMIMYYERMVQRFSSWSSEGLPAVIVFEIPTQIFREKNKIPFFSK